MAAPCVSACTPWATAEDIHASCGIEDEALLDTMLEIATDILFMLSARQFPGICSNVFRPEHGAHVHRNGCLVGNEIDLGVYPLIEVTEIKVYGRVLDPSKYRVDDYRTLVRLPDAGTTPEVWPSFQRFDLDASQDDTFEVTATYGLMPPPAGVNAAAVLACELAKAATGGDCKLPERVTSISRQGTTMDFSGLVLDPFAFFEQGRTGLYQVDLFLASVNPNGLKRRPRVYSPDSVRKARKAGTG